MSTAIDPIGETPRSVGGAVGNPNPRAAASPSPTTPGGPALPIEIRPERRHHWLVLAIAACAACAGTGSVASSGPAAVAPPASAPTSCGSDAGQAPMLIGRVSLGKTQIAFAYAGDVWLVGREGGEARRVPGPPATPTDHPAFSPDGTQLAFSRQIAGNWDVYVMPAAGGEPRRLTDHPAPDHAVGWTPSGQRVLFSSNRTAPHRRLFTVPADGSEPLPSELPLPRAAFGSMSPDGTRIAYSPMGGFIDSWRVYRGGDQGLVWLVSLRDGALERLPHGTANDLLPMWNGNHIYFLSDRTGTYNLYAYDLTGKQTRQLTAFATHGIRWAAAAPDAIALVCDGRLQLYDVATGTSRAVAVHAAADPGELAPRTASAAQAIEEASLSQTGDTAVLSARGELFLVDPATGRARNLTGTPGAAERSGALSPDGAHLAYFSDESGEYHLHIRDVERGAVTRIAIEPAPSFYRELVWSPDGKKIAFTDKRLAIWYADVARGTAKRIDRSTYSYQDRFFPAWSPDGRFLTYAKHLHNRIGAVFIHDLADGVTHQVTDGRMHAESPTFDKSGKYLYFVSSPNAGTGEFGWSVLNGLMARPLVTRSMHLLVLQRGQPSPIVPGGRPNPGAGLDAIRAADQVHIDFDGLDRRVVDLPLEPRDFAQLIAGPPGKVFVVVHDWPASPSIGADPSHPLYLYDLARPQALDARIVERLTDLAVSGDGKRVLYAIRNDWFMVTAGEPIKPGAGKLELGKLEVQTDPRAEWRQMVHEAWRIMRDWFYDPGHHGQDLAALERHYAAYLPSVTRRADLTELLNRMLGHVSVSHLRVWGGDQPRPQPPSRTGLLGADYEISAGHYRFRHIYRSTPYNSSAGSVVAPLDQPGVTVREGEYLLEVEGQKVEASRGVDGYFENRADQPTRVTIGPSPDGAGARSLTVYPRSDEGPLRVASWAEANRRRVDELSHGRVGYIYAGNYGPGTLDVIRGLLGYSDLPGIIIDQRNNGGGVTPDYLIEWLRRRPLYYYMFREGDDIATPVNPGPAATVLLVNEGNYSAAETFAFMYKLAGVGPIVGTRTGGGGIGPYVFTPPLLDGGRVQLPNRAAYNPDGSSFGIENLGISPDREVVIAPSDLLAGRDPQLEQAVTAALEEIAKHPPTAPRHPRYPVYP